MVRKQRRQRRCGDLATDVVLEEERAPGRSGRMHWRRRGAPGRSGRRVRQRLVHRGGGVGGGGHGGGLHVGEVAQEEERALAGRPALEGGRGDADVRVGRSGRCRRN
ncbi:hypothetical protein E2562_023079 [Oryza meyeriana var. granulata]|uniref:DUF834 domain-containing protein n=1 Tax=Oryza meyeriana var. granulata TaxID=110450 RepID=A0A6G1EP05_9ORYZ|nr:hypothetical protein E2562_023079 [Oryza meyeriana var. granulata]